MATQAAPFVTLEEYIAHEEQTDHKSEYLDGEVFPMEDATPNHAAIVVRIGTALQNALGDGECTVFGSSLRLSIQASGLCTYPDVTVICGRPQYSPQDKGAITNPKVLFEVESPTSQDRDMGKFIHYRTLPSLQEYVIVSQTEPSVNHFTRQPGDSWTVRQISGMDAVLTLDSLSIRVPLAAIYRNISFDKA
jgi:Uma2 family endonuclease